MPVELCMGCFSPGWQKGQGVLEGVCVPNDSDWPHVDLQPTKSI